jgi:hypothetical protein
LVRDCIERHVSAVDIYRIRQIEAAEREQLQLFGQQLM